LKTSAPAPLAAALGIFITLMMMKARDLSAPLWLTNQLFKWGALNGFLFVFLGYVQLQRQINNEN